MSWSWCACLCYHWTLDVATWAQRIPIPWGWTSLPAPSQWNISTYTCRLSKRIYGNIRYVKTWLSERDFAKPQALPHFRPEGQDFALQSIEKYSIGTLSAHSLQVLGATRNVSANASHPLMNRSKMDWDLEVTWLVMQYMALHHWLSGSLQLEILLSYSTCCAPSTCQLLQFRPCGNLPVFMYIYLSY